MEKWPLEPEDFSTGLALMVLGVGIETSLLLAILVSFLAFIFVFLSYLIFLSMIMRIIDNFRIGQEFGGILLRS